MRKIIQFDADTVDEYLMTRNARSPCFRVRYTPGRQLTKTDYNFVLDIEECEKID